MSEAIEIIRSGSEEFRPRSLVECGVGPALKAFSRQFWGKAECLLIEPDPRLHDELEVATRGIRAMCIWHCAIGMVNGRGAFVLENQGWSHLGGESSPSSECQGYGGAGPSTIEVDVRTFDRLDPGNLDAALLDMEGGEWLVIKSMISRPKLITVEMDGDRLRRLGLPGGLPGYKNPYYEEIMRWMTDNDYDIAYWSYNDVGFASTDVIDRYNWGAYDRQAKLSRKTAQGGA